MAKTKQNQNVLTMCQELITSFYHRWADIAKLVRLETKLAMHSIVRLSVVIYLFGFFLVASWLSLLFIAFLYFLSLQYTLLHAATLILGINIFMVMSLLIYILILKRRISFPVTRQQFARKDGLEEPHYD